jgi:hypothetical protein
MADAMAVFMLFLLFYASKQHLRIFYALRMQNLSHSDIFIESFDRLMMKMWLGNDPPTGTFLA